MADVRIREQKQYNRGLGINKDRPMGRRSISRDWASGGKIRAKAPRSLRRMGRKWLDDCTDEEIAKAVFGINLAAMKRDFDKKHFSTLKGQTTKTEKALADTEAALKSWIPQPDEDAVQTRKNFTEKIVGLTLAKERYISQMEEMEYPIKEAEAFVANFRSAK
jgi:hypothetical protein